MPDYAWEVAKRPQSGSGGLSGLTYRPGGMGLDFQTTPGYYVNAAGQYVLNNSGAPVGPAGGTGTPGGASGTGTGTNPYWTISNTKSQPIQDTITGALSDWTKQKLEGTKALADFSAESAASRGASRGFLNQENTNVGGYFNGQVQSRLDKLLADQVAADQAAAGQAKLEAGGTYKKLGIAGASDVYRNRMIDAALAKINSEAAQRQTAQQMANYQWLTGAQRSLLGQRSGAETNYLNTGLIPLQANTAWQTGMLQNLGAINALDKSNMFYGLNTTYNPNYEGYLGTPPGVAPSRGYSASYGSNPTLARGGYANMNLPSAVNSIPVTSNYGAASGYWPSTANDYAGPVSGVNYGADYGTRAPAATGLDPAAANNWWNSYLDYNEGY
jgi:hypothetical protein